MAEFALLTKLAKQAGMKKGEFIRSKIFADEYKKRGIKPCKNW